MKFDSEILGGQRLAIEYNFRGEWSGQTPFRISVDSIRGSRQGSARGSRWKSHW